VGSLDWNLLLYDFVSAPSDGQVHRIEGSILSRQTRFQKVDIYQSEGFGKILTLDNRVQSLERDEFVYHEAFIHPAMVHCREPKRVLVIGGGEGACLREVLRHSTVEQAVMVDIDGELVELCRKHLPTWHQGAFDSPRVKFLAQDAKDYVQECRERFDVVIVDLSEPTPGTPAYFLFTVEFYQLLARVLQDGAVVTFQSDAPALHAPAIWSITVNTIRQVFPYTRPYVCTVPGFGSEWGFTLASFSPLQEMDAAQVDDVLAQRTAADKLRFYDGATHERLFRLPKYMRQWLADETRSFTLDNPPLDKLL
jgi:spermidine synthase